MPTSIYILIGIVIIVFVLRIILGGKEKIEEKPEDVSEIKNFYLRKELMSYSERKLFEVLKKELGLEYLIFSKVRIEDFIGANKFGITSQKHFGLRNRIKSYHVDFLICDTVTTKPLFAIELDGASHNSHERKERDTRFNKIYEKVGLSIKHIKVGENFEEKVKELKMLK